MTNLEKLKKFAEPSYYPPSSESFEDRLRCWKDEESRQSMRFAANAYTAKEAARILCFKDQRQCCFCSELGKRFCGGFWKDPMCEDHIAEWLMKDADEL